MIKKYLHFIKEADENDIEAVDGVKSLSKDKYQELTDEVKSMIDKTIEDNGGEFDTFVDSFIKNPEDVKINGFINDSDIYEFYLKWRNDIDEILNTVGFYDKKPTDLNAFGLYDYMIKGTQEAINEVIKLVK